LRARSILPGLENSRPAAMDVAGETTGDTHMKSTQKNRPYAVYVVEGEGDNAYFTKVGAAWPHKDGDGFNITLTAVPLNGRLVVRKPKANADREAGR
jgi:hypothetical protein